jgi:hypothetical protein
LSIVNRNRASSSSYVSYNTLEPGITYWRTSFLM